MAFIALLIDPAPQAWLGQKGLLLQLGAPPQDYRIDPSNPEPMDIINAPYLIEGW